MRGRKREIPITAEEKRARDRRYYQEHREHKLAYAKEYREKNRDLIAEKMSLYYRENKHKVLKTQTKYHANRLRDDSSYRIACNLRARLGSALKAQGTRKKNTTLELLGCTKEKLREHLETQFKEGMSWDNYGRNGWHIDHVRPLCAFDLSNQNELRDACHFSNLQPLWAKENLAKRFKRKEDAKGNKAT